MAKTAVVLMNLGGPDSLEAVRPFLRNLFSDRRIIGVPGPIRWVLARLISWRRAPVAREIYRALGGSSPLLANTEEQARALEAAIGDPEISVFVAMRYWHPFTSATVRKVMDWGAEKVILLPLYPQFSSTTTGSSAEEWDRACRQAGYQAPARLICCYPTEPGFVATVAEAARSAVSEMEGPCRVLFSAHGLPEKVIEAGDPYQEQVEQTASAIAQAMDLPQLDWLVCYQSRVGPLKWIGPSTEEEIHRAGADRVGVVIVPVAFVSEHSETLYELDIEYRELAESLGVPGFSRVRTVGSSAHYINGLAEIVKTSLNTDMPVFRADSLNKCSGIRSQCPCLNPIS